MEGPPPQYTGHERRDDIIKAQLPSLEALRKFVVVAVISITPPSARGEGLAGLFLGAYIGVAIPVVGLGVATLWVSLPVSVLGLTVVLAAVIIASTRRLLLQ